MTTNRRLALARALLAVPVATAVIGLSNIAINRAVVDYYGSSFRPLLHLLQQLMVPASVAAVACPLLGWLLLRRSGIRLNGWLVGGIFLCIAASIYMTVIMMVVIFLMS